jgi:multicomponent Na+:H+ antiporter subunit G
MDELAPGLLAIVGSALVALAGIGVVRFPDVYARMHAATKAPTLGFICIATAATLTLADSRGKLVLAIALILVTAPIAAHLVARAAYRAPSGLTTMDADDDLAPTVDRQRQP